MSYGQDKNKYLIETMAEFEKIAYERFLTMSDGSDLRILEHNFEKDKQNGFTLFVIAGWGSVVLGWDDFLLEALKHFNIIYLETREKASSRLPKKTKHTMDRMSLDVQEVLSQLEIDENKLILFGSCFGAIVIADGLSKNKYDPFLSILVAPPPMLELPKGTRYIVPIAPTFLFEPIKPILIYWINKKSESQEQAAKYTRVLMEANAKKWKKVGNPICRKRYWRLFPKISSRTLLVGAEEDKMHNIQKTNKIANMIPNVIYRNLRTNHDTHSPLMVETIRDVLTELLEG